MIVERPAADGGVVMQGPARLVKGTSLALMAPMVAFEGILLTGIVGPAIGGVVARIVGVLCLVIAVPIAVLCWRNLQMSVTADRSGLTVRNALRVHHVPWSDVVALSTLFGAQMGGWAGRWSSVGGTVYGMSLSKP